MNFATIRLRPVFTTASVPRATRTRLDSNTRELAKSWRTIELFEPTLPEPKRSSAPERGP